MVKYCAFERDGFDGDPLKENEQAINSVIEETGWNFFDVEVLPDRIVATPYSFIKQSVLMGQIKVTNIERGE
ncbi:MAG TPA: hypothetical protein VFD03_06160 [Clostridia bacterium]|nr:hypothetical protein [Clostridia bacterium]